MTNPDSPAFPQPEVHHAGSCTGLTKREYFAGLAMQGILACPLNIRVDGNLSTATDGVIKVAVKMADYLLSELEQTKTKTPEPQRPKK